ncbi:MAG: succinate dehydrogenase, cytochrome b556 subunit [Betaproteobacteria bacterium]
MTTAASARSRASRDPAAWHAFVVHRVSGLLLVLFLPAHFLVLGTALGGPAGLEPFLTWTRQPVVKVAETLLVLALAAHLAGGLRLLFVEFVGWRAASQKTWLAAGLFVAILCALLFALNVRS